MHYGKNSFIVRALLLSCLSTFSVSFETNTDKNDGKIIDGCSYENILNPLHGKNKIIFT